MSSGARAKKRLRAPRLRGDRVARVEDQAGRVGAAHADSPAARVVRSHEDVVVECASLRPPSLWAVVGRREVEPEAVSDDSFQPRVVGGGDALLGQSQSEERRGSYEERAPSRATVAGHLAGFERSLWCHVPC
eukprot:CAMPEP_0113272352 /NCGR_PEP_ID=MMETSP0008_2-20120614/23279_1 /TAXON_ID=97485 /ORGANISM="Prymnesium parvum" /LENGTH=132 /DNA_ID=CAMNT_0000121811 /DNA_START=536 /DNA_END=935 /DNA_ORIENTATION=- /assembly_acc=CAM_ASM_000153